jgi:hypothetical protein
MVAARLTSFSKFIITALILAVIFFGGKYVLNNTSAGMKFQETLEEAQAETNNENTKASNESASTKSTSSSTAAAIDKDGNKVLRVQLVSWGGYAPGLYFNK